MTTDLAAESRDDHATSADAVAEAVRAALLGCDAPVLLAVSGGVDSMVLLHAASDVARDRLAGVATFDHGTGDAARRASELAARAAAACGLRVLSARADLPNSGEAAWREARWRFLRDAARTAGASFVATAHTRGDQVETVVMRILRGAGARGLAALAARTPGIVRPLLGVDRAAIDRYAAAHGVSWIEDPSNRSPRYLRNRVRHELLPAVRRAAPDLPDALIALADRAAAWRRDVDAFVERHVPLTWGPRGAFHVATAQLAAYDADVLAVLWPAIAARGGVRLDRRGTARLVQFTIAVAAGAAVGAEMQLSGAIDVTAGRGEIVLAPRPLARTSLRDTRELGAAELPLNGDVHFGGWRFRPSAWGRAAEDETEGAADDVWSAWLHSDRGARVRAWRPGDRMRLSPDKAARRVKRFLADARIAGRARAGWPVVVIDDEIVWIPGVRRSRAATDRPERPGVHYICERIDERSDG